MISQILSYVTIVYYQIAHDLSMLTHETKEMVLIFQQTDSERAT